MEKGSAWKGTAVEEYIVVSIKPKTMSPALQLVVNIMAIHENLLYSGFASSPPSLTLA